MLVSRSDSLQLYRYISLAVLRCCHHEVNRRITNAKTETSYKLAGHSGSTGPSLDTDAHTLEIRWILISREFFFFFFPSRCRKFGRVDKNSQSKRRDSGAAEK